MKLPNVGIHGKIERHGVQTIVYVRDCRASSYPDGVECLNPDAPEDERVYRKIFTDKRIYLSHEHEKARHDLMNGEDILVLGMTGYSSIGSDRLQRLGITDDTYVRACVDLMEAVIFALQHEYRGIQLRIVDGASRMGVDRALIEVANNENIPNLGFSCPRFMMYVADGDGEPVFVASSQTAYAEAFIGALDVLICTGGRRQALEHDVLAAIQYDKRLVFAPVLQMISPNGGLPARNPDGSVEDATAAFLKAIPQLELADVKDYGDFRERIAELVVRVVRQRLSPMRAYSRYVRRGG